MNNLLGYPRHRSQDPVFRLLLLEDDVDLGAALLKSLTYAGFSSVWSRRARDANERIAGQGFGLILLDIQRGRLAREISSRSGRPHNARRCVRRIALCRRPADKHVRKAYKEIAHE